MWVRNHRPAPFGSRDLLEVVDARLSRMPIVPGKTQLLHHGDGAGMATETSAVPLLRGERIDIARCRSELPDLVRRSLPVELVKIVHAIDLVPGQDLEVRRLGKRRGIERERQKYVG